jgi:hypothetical protein
MYFNLDLPIISIILFGVAFAAALITFLIYVLKIRRVSKAYVRAGSLSNAVDSDLDTESDTESPNDVEPQPQPGDDLSLEPASVIVYANDQAENLQHLLPQLLGQVYPAGFEIVVVNDGASDDTRDLVERLRMYHANLYLTYTPDGVRALSRKKLALTIGIKAARNRVVVNTTAGVSIESPYWLMSMMRHFSDPEVEVVLGYSIPSNDDDQMGKRRRAFDWVASGVNWLSSALKNKPYRGTEFNVAYTREIFFANKGFSHSLNLKHGDDDVFINEITNSENTRVELSADSIVRVNMYNHRREQSFLARSHRFTGHHLPKATRRSMALGAWLMWIALGASIAGALFSTDIPTGTFSGVNILAVSLAVVLILLAILPATLSWRRLIKLVGSRSMFFTLPYFALTRPIRNISLALKSRLKKDRNYTWR